MIEKEHVALIDILLQKNTPFAAYRLPKCPLSKIISQKQREVKQIDLLDIDEFKGMVIAPFESAHSGSAYLIEPDFIIENGMPTPEFSRFLDSLPNTDFPDLEIENHVINHHAYINNADYLINLLQKEELHKVVLSRVISMPIKKGLSYQLLFDQLSIAYPEAFVYLFHLPEKGIWCGATPELLLSVNHTEASTMALAGTRLYDPETTNTHWLEKETHEQSIVSQFITSILSANGIQEYQTEKPVTLRAGHLEHRLTRFTIPRNHINGKTGKIIMGLHPTPAVCGLPKGDAYHLIKRAEQHQRRFYTGFLGPWNLDEQSDLFVNLRCAEFAKKSVNLYVGGGLTAASVAEMEWDETILKSQTLLTVIEKMQTFAP